MRRLTLALILSLAFPMQGWAAHIQSACTTFPNASQTSDTYTPASAITPGNLIVLSSGSSSRTVTSIAGNVSLTTSINGAHTTWGGGNVSIWKGVATGSDTQFTINYSGAVGDTLQFCFAEFSDASSDQSGSTANGAAHTAVNGAHNSGSVTPPTASNIVTAFTVRANDTWTEDGGFTEVSGSTSLMRMAYLIQAAATAQEYNMTSTISRDSGMRIGAFAGASTASSDFSRRRLQANP